MPFRTPGRHAAALILAALALLLQACATALEDARRFDPAPGMIPAQTARGTPPATGPGEIWQVLEGARVDPGALQPLFGVEDTRFMQPIAVAAREHLLYVVDAGHRQLFAWDRRTDRLTVVRDLRGILHGDAADIYLNVDYSFYIADPDGARVIHFDAGGRQLRTFEDRINIGRPVGVSVNDTTGYVFIADGFNDDVMVFNPGGLLTGAIGSRGLGSGRFLGITAFARGPQGYYVGTRFGKTRVQVMNFDGTFLDALQPDTVTFPTAIAVGPDGRVYVADYLADDIKVYEGTRLIGTIGGHGSAPGRFRRITDLWIDGGFLYVADSLNRRVQILTLASWEPEAPVGETGETR